MAECPKCGTMNYTPYCTECGTEIIFKCKKCGLTVKINQKYCGWCGTENPFFSEKEEIKVEKEKKTK